MRIISGKYRGKKLLSPKSDKVRPTSDQARESVFNIINSKLESSWQDIDLLDVFAGTGAFGLEALSRGAKSVTMIDIDTSSAQRNIALFEAEKQKIKLIKTDATKPPIADKKYNLAFFDAPYNQELSQKALISINNKNWLAEECLCIIELEKTEEFSSIEGFELIDTRCYGITKFVFIQKNKQKY